MTMRDLKRDWELCGRLRQKPPTHAGEWYEAETREGDNHA